MEGRLATLVADEAASLRLVQRLQEQLVDAEAEHVAAALSAKLKDVREALRATQAEIRAEREAAAAERRAEREAAERRAEREATERRAEREATERQAEREMRLEMDARERAERAVIARAKTAPSSLVYANTNAAAWEQVKKEGLLVDVTVNKDHLRGLLAKRFASSIPDASSASTTSTTSRATTATMEQLLSLKVAQTQGLSEADLQGLLFEHLEKLCPKGLRVHNTAASPVLGSRKPDFCVTKASAVLSSVTILATAELKAKLRSNGFSNEHLGEALTWVQLTLEYQPWRVRVDCLVVDAQFVARLSGLRNRRDIGDVTYELTTLLPYAADDRSDQADIEAALGLVVETLFPEAAPDVPVPSAFQHLTDRKGGSLEVNQTRYEFNANSAMPLSVARHGHVYRLSMRKDETQEPHEERVVKIPFEPGLVQTEVAALRKLYAHAASLQKGRAGEAATGTDDAENEQLYRVSHLVGASLTPPALLLAFEGDATLDGSGARLLPPPKLADLVRTLRFVHGAGLVHRDVRPANVCLRPRGHDEFEPVLVDFGLAVDVGSAGATSRMVGTAAYAADIHLRLMSEDVNRSDLPYSPATDLESLVKTWCTYMLGSGYVAYSITRELNVRVSGGQQSVESRTRALANLQRVWSGVFRLFTPSLESEALPAARACDYERLETWMRRVGEGVVSLPSKSSESKSELSGGVKRSRLGMA